MDVDGQKALDYLEQWRARQRPKAIPVPFEMGKKSGKEKADDVPSWAKGNRPLPGESGRDFADRIMKDRFGDGWREAQKKGPASDYNKIKKWGDRGFNK